MYDEPKPTKRNRSDREYAEKKSVAPIVIDFASETSKDILKKVSVSGKFRNKIELCKLIEKQGIKVIYPDSMLGNK